MRRAIRATSTVVGASFRAAPLRATVVFLMTILEAASTVLFGLWVKLVVDAVAAGDEREVAFVAVGFALTIGLGSALNWSGFLLRQGLRERTGLLLDERIVELASGVPTLEHFERPDYLDEVELLREERAQLSQALDAIVLNLGILARVAGTLGLLATIHPALVLLPLFGIPSVFTGGQAERWRYGALQASAEPRRRARHLFDLATTAGPAKELRVFGTAPSVLRHHRDELEAVDRHYTRARVRGAALTAAGWLVFGLGYVGALVFVTAEAVEGRATPGDVLLVLTLASQVNEEVSSTVRMVTWLLHTLKVVGRYLWLLEYAEKAQAPIADPAPAPDRLERGIELDRVSFRYPGTEVDTLTDVSIVLPAGTTVAVVGDNGAGKTTLIKLLCRFYEPTGGRIMVDGVDLARVEPRDWRLRMAGGFQDFARLELAAGETVGVGDLGRLDDSEAVTDALVRAGGTDVVDTLPDGLQTLVGRSFEGGLELSGGQWQKLALGRAMMRPEPLLLVLDEPTANLDAETEHALFERYASAARRVSAGTGAITILVSHRFSTVRMADLILVVDGGRLVESGSHEELIAEGALYAELFELQARAYR